MVLVLEWRYERTIFTKLDYIYEDKFSDILVYNSHLPYIELIYTDSLEYKSTQNFNYCEPFIKTLPTHLKDN